jgi:hypothetical protein
MEKDFIPYQEALELKQLGFDGSHYILCVDTPDGREYTKVGECPILYSQAFRFFREKYSMHGYVEGAYPWFRFYINWDDDRCEGHKESTYEEAELACLRKLIEIVKQK